MKIVWGCLLIISLLALSFVCIASDSYNATLHPANPGSVIQLAELTSSDGGFEDSFGTSVAASGDTVVIGAPFHTAVGSSGRGAAYVFVKPVSGWTNMTETAELTASDGVALDTFGFAVAINGNVVVVGDYSHDGYIRPTGGWKTTASPNVILKAADGAADDFFGSSVALGPKTAMVGAFNHTVDGHPLQGAAYVFGQQ